MKLNILKSAMVCVACQLTTALPCSAIPVPQVTEAPQIDLAAANDSTESLFRRAVERIKVHDDLIVEAFKQTHDGWSSDEVVLQDDLNDKFLKACETKLAAAGVEDAKPAALNWRLLALRKAGKLKVKSTKRAPAQMKSATTAGSGEAVVQDAADIAALAEIAMRSMQDKRKVSSDRIMTDPGLRSEFEAIVVELNSKADLYLTRKAAFQLRKTRRLQPELISRLADWGREVKIYAIEDLRKSTDSVDTHPGIYIFRNQTGYLYIGQTENLRQRMAEHLEESHNASLASYLKSDKDATVELHSFDPKSRAKEVRVRRAYESELIRSRKPRFNVLP